MALPCRMLHLALVVRMAGADEISHAARPLFTLVRVATLQVEPPAFRQF